MNTPPQSIRRISMCLSLLVVLVLSACGGPSVTQEPSAGAMMPNLTDYNITDVQNIQDAIAKLGSVASLGSGQPEVTAAIAGLTGVLDCFQKAGAIQGRTYINKTNPVLAGLVVIVNRAVLTDPNVLVNCTVPHLNAAARPLAGTQLQPCAKTYTLNKNNNQFYVAYAATDTQVCSAFCSALEGCQ